MKTFLIKAFATIQIIYYCTACTGGNREQSADDMDKSPAFPYYLDKPDDRFWLPAELEEISGLTYMKEGVLATVQDEKGIIYLYDINSTSVVNRIKFGKAGDYEDITLVDNTAYIIRSDGELYKVSLSGASIDTQVYQTPLTAKNDVEGLTYDTEGHRLLLACKGISGLDKDNPDIRAVYAFDLNRHTLQKEPIFAIPVKEVEKLAGNKDNFRPSGIAIHPVNELVYIVASVGKVLIVLNKNGSIEAVRPLPARYFRQPEGICFAPNGDMFISNEGKGGMASILRYNFAP
jgi:uncharacterized protein YjiK